MERQKFSSEEGQKVYEAFGTGKESMEDLERRLGRTAHSPEAMFQAQIELAEQKRSELDNVGMENLKDKKVIYAFAKTFGLIPSLEKRIQRQVQRFDTNLVEMKSYTQNAQKQYEKFNESRFREFGNKHIAGELMFRYGQIKEKLTEKKESLQENIRAAQKEGESQLQDYLSELNKVIADYAKSETMEVEYAGEVQRLDQAERNYKNFAVQSKLRLEYCRDSVQNAKLLLEGMKIHLEYSDDPMQFWNIMKTNYQEGKKVEGLLAKITELNKPFFEAPPTEFRQGIDEDLIVQDAESSSRRIDEAKKILEAGYNL